MNDNIINKTDNAVKIHFYIMVIAIFFITINKMLFSEGMFMDGLIYAAISKNLANGHGSFWDLYLSDTYNLHFRGHPPLAFGLQSIFFYLFGESFYIEKIYSVITFLLTGIIIVKIWQNLDYTDKKLSWLPLFFWVMMPYVNWCAVNNQLENTMMIFTTLSIFFLIKSQQNYNFLYLCFAGISIALAFLSKGFVALFPYTFLFCRWLFLRDKKFISIIYQTFILIISSALPIILILLINPKAHIFFLEYLDIQVFSSIKNGEPEETRFFILQKLFVEHIASIIFISLIILLLKIKKHSIKLDKQQIYLFVIFFAVALSGVLPIMITTKQRGFYILTVSPLFSIAYAILTYKYAIYLFHNFSESTLKRRILKIINVILISIAIIIAIVNYNTLGRDRILLKDIHAVLKIVPPQTTINVSNSECGSWTLYGYFARYGNISLECNATKLHKYFLCSKNDTTNIIKNYTKKEIQLEKFFLYEKQ